MYQVIVSIAKDAIDVAKSSTIIANELIIALELKIISYFFKKKLFYKIFF